MKWRAVVLAAGRGPNDPMAKAYGVAHKCAVPIAGKPMLARVVETLASSPRISTITISIEDARIGQQILGALAERVSFSPSLASAAQSAACAIEDFPTLLTTADHPLLTVPMIDHFLDRSESADADLAVGLASAETILAAFPAAQRTFLVFGKDRVSGCNLFGLRTERARIALDFWRHLEPVRKKPWRLVSAFGPVALARFLTGRIDLESAFALASRRLGLSAAPILLPFAEAAIDVDKPADKDLAEEILAARPATSPPPSCAPAADRPGNPPRTR